VEGRPLILGGVEIPHSKGLLGHSDADALLHAITDAILGAAALGDIGSHFPDTDAQFKGADSAVMLRDVARLVRAKGFEIGNVDSTVIAQAPKLAPHIGAMRHSIAQALGVSADQRHVGHGRQGALGDAICGLYESQGWAVTREFYYNDAGVQIATLARSTQARILGLKPGDDGWPADAYNGDYIADIAADFLAGATVHADDRAFTASGDPQDIDSIRQFAVAYLRHEQDLDLQAFGVKFQNYFLESSLYLDGKVEHAVARLKAAGKTYQSEGALWLRSTDYGDDKDRVMRKSDGSYTYFVPDVAYHIDKWQRGFDKVVNVQGTDHHGTIARVRAGLQAAAVGIPQGWPDYLLNKMVTVMKGGVEVKISKRTGGYVTLRDLIEWTSRDAVRFFLISRKADTEFVFDVDLALKANDENPVFYVQYAHARICSVLAQYTLRTGKNVDIALDPGVDLSLLTAATETALMLKLAAYPDMLSGAAADFAPHDVAFYLRDLAAAFHSWYGAERFLIDDAALAAARMALLAATRQVLRNALAMMGVSAPDAMNRDAVEAAAAP
jgi:arginyl-tRNA synthetase